MKVGFLLFNVDGGGGTERSVVTQANALAADGQDVTIISVVRERKVPHYEVDKGVRIVSLVDRVDQKRPRSVDNVVRDDVATRLAGLPSLLVPKRWDPQFSALTDAACERTLPALDVDVLVTVTPGLLAMAVQLAPSHVAIVHQEHRSSADRTAGMEPLLTFAPRADVVALLTPSMSDWLTETLAPTPPRTIVMPNPLPLGFKPRSTLETQLIVTAGRFVIEKQFSRLIRAFGEIADEIPSWRLRILGSGMQRWDLLRTTRKLGLYDRIELPGQSADMPSEWARASIAALSSRTEGLPLVVQEAMAAGVPVAAYDAPSGARALIEHDVNGLLVAPESTPGLATALLRLATDDDLRHRLGEGAFQSSRAYLAEVIAKRWMGVFQDAVERRSRQPRRTLRRAMDLVASASERPAQPAAATDTTPAEARSIALAWAVQCAERASSRWFVVPSHGTDAVTVVLPMTDRPAFFAELGAAQAPPLLSLVDTAGRGWPERRGSLPDMAPVMAREHTGRVSLEPWPEIDGLPGLLSTGCRIDLEFWEAGPDGILVAPEPNAYTRRVHPDTEKVETEVEGVRVRTLQLMTEPTVLDCTFPIDAVYTWVDGDDAEWNVAREARLAQVTGTAHTKESSGRARYATRDELRYSMRSIYLFAPWIRTIHLVTGGQVPPWLLEHPRVRVVDHREILPADALPTFNSHAIESSLHKLPDLAEHFIYFNDDFMLGRPQPPQMFFTPSGQASVFFSPFNLGLDEGSNRPPWLMAALNNRQLLRKTFGVINTHSLQHAPYAHRRSVLEEIEKRFPDELARTARSPFRSDTDIALLSSLAQHYGLATGAAVVADAEIRLVDISANDVARRVRGLQQRDQDFFCLADHHEHAVRPEVLNQLLENFFEFYFPLAPPWEKTP